MIDPEVQAERAAVVAAIEQAFDGVPLGGGVTLHQARAIDDYEPEDVQQAARALDAEARWQDVPDEKLRHLSDTLVFLDPDGYRFYLPAFLRWVLRHLDDNDDEHSGLAWSTIYSLDNSDVLGRSVQHTPLDEPQRRAVCLFLRHLARHSKWWRQEAGEHLRNFWGRYYGEADA